MFRLIFLLLNKSLAAVNLNLILNKTTCASKKQIKTIYYSTILHIVKDQEATWYKFLEAQNGILHYKEGRVVSVNIYDIKCLVVKIAI